MKLKFESLWYQTCHCNKRVVKKYIFYCAKSKATYNKNEVSEFSEIHDEMESNKVLEISDIHEEKTYDCRMCPSIFSQKGRLKKHIDIVWE